ncbi:hypothetical protein [Alkalicoccus chagannorensis]|uniref:hypothetical protein n=1 Tax=Alkalicoccus chagannorensis TaxID=427072 RepID=UPI0003FCA125|nr:hypothetical protein [Alkalicoccus chagannorensis]
MAMPVHEVQEGWKKRAEEGEHGLGRLPAAACITADRLDLVLKINYIDYREKGYDLPFFQRIYRNHLQLVKGIPDSGIESELHHFHAIIEGMRENGWPVAAEPLCLSRSGAVLGDGYEAAAAAYFGLTVPVQRTEEQGPVYDAAFFRRHQVEEADLDFLLTEYCRKKPGTYFACNWPRASGIRNENIEAVMAQTCSIVYKQEVWLNYRAVKHLMTQIYPHADWIGSLEDRYAGIQPKVDSCHDPDRPLTIYILEGAELEEIVQMKADIRTLFPMGNDCIHITDNQQETVQLADLVLNRTSLRFLNDGLPYASISFNQEVRRLKERLLAENIPLEECVVRSSGTLRLYGIQTVQETPLAVERLTEQTEAVHWLDPSCYFVYQDMKFAALDILKAEWQEAGYRRQARTADRLLQGKPPLRVKLQKQKPYTDRWIRTSMAAAWQGSVAAIKKTGIHRPLKSVYRRLKA